ncbi:MAG: hypothetical protein ACOCPM_05415, partial [Bacteroidales bacterium]
VRNIFLALDYYFTIKKPVHEFYIQIKKIVRERPLRDMFDAFIIHENYCFCFLQVTNYMLAYYFEPGLRIPGSYIR